MKLMRVRALGLMIAALVIMSAPAALAKMPQQPSGDGGLEVSGGGIAGYVGGSGSISGSVRGPSGGPGGSVPSGEPTAEKAPSVLNDGVVADTDMPAPVTRKVSNATRASAVWPGVMAPTMVATLTAAGVLLLFRRRPQLS